MSGREHVQRVHVCEPQPRLGQATCPAPGFKTCLLMCLFTGLFAAFMNIYQCCCSDISWEEVRTGGEDGMSEGS